MKSLSAAFWAESLKVRRSKMLWITILVFALIAMMLGFLVFAAKHPELVKNSAALSAKASIIGKADWPAYFGLLTQCILALGSMGFGFVTSWVFGREYSDRTVKDILALPVARRTIIVLAKLMIIVIWCILLSLTLFFIGLLTGIVVNIAGWSGAIACRSFWIFAGSSILTILLCTPAAFFACYGRGYLLPIGFVIFTLMITQFVFLGIPGITPYFPWAIPALYSGIAGPGSPHPVVLSYVILVFTSILGLIGTFAWWQFADQT